MISNAEKFIMDEIDYVLENEFEELERRLIYGCDKHDIKDEVIEKVYRLVDDLIQGKIEEKIEEFKEIRRNMGVI